MFQRWYSNLHLNQKIFLLTSGVLTVLSLLSLGTLFVLANNLSNSQIVPKTFVSVASVYRHPIKLKAILSSPETASEELMWINEYPLVDHISIYVEGKLYASYSKNEYRAPDSINELPTVNEREHNFYLTALRPHAPMVHLFIRANMTSLETTFNNGVMAFAVVFIGALLLSLFGTRLAQRSITRPVTHLMNIARMVSADEDYEVRAQKFHNDEIGALVDAFNGMLQKIENRDRQLQAEKEKAERTQRQAQELANETREANKRLEFEVHVRTKIEKKLTDFQSYLNSIINSMPSALIAVDEHFFITLWNKEASVLSGTPLESALGYSLEEAFSILGNYMDDISHALIEHEIKRVPSVTFQDQNGESQILDLIIYPLNRTGTLGAVIRMDNVTEKNHMEEVMVQTEKMMSVGGLAAGMAHEINNPLSAIIQGAQNIKRRTSSDLPSNAMAAEELGLNILDVTQYLENRQILRFLDNIQKAGERAAHIVTNMLQFSRQSTRTLMPASVPELLTQALEIASSDYNLKKGYDFKQIQIDTNFDHVNRPVPCAKQEIEQVVLNLIKNAAQAIHERSLLNEENFDGRIEVRSFIDRNYCYIQIEDNGIGMDNDVRKRIFEPFFTTKDIGVGTGLGLSVSFFIITSHHSGTMEVRSEPMKGTCFTIGLPLVMQTSKADNLALQKEA